MSGDPENQDTEELTDEERALGESLASSHGDTAMVVAKLLRIHDAQRERITELNGIGLDLLEWVALEASGFDSEAIELGKRAAGILEIPSKD